MQQSHEQACEELRQGHAEEVIRRLQEVTRQSEASHAADMDKLNAVHDSQLAEVTRPLSAFLQ